MYRDGVEAWMIIVPLEGGGRRIHHDVFEDKEEAQATAKIITRLGRVMSPDAQPARLSKCRFIPKEPDVSSMIERAVHRAHEMRRERRLAG